MQHLVLWTNTILDELVCKVWSVIFTCCLCDLPKYCETESADIWCTCFTHEEPLCDSGYNNVGFDQVLVQNQEV